MDPAAAARMEPTNGRRTVRALEVIALTGSMPEAMTAYDALYDVVQVGLDAVDLAGRVATRVDRMWAAGLVASVAGLVPAGLREGVTASRALGYAQVLAHLGGELSEGEARTQTVTATRRYVRRQRAWFRCDPRCTGSTATGPSSRRPSSCFCLRPRGRRAHRG